VNNPLGTQDAATYKLASPTTDVGTLRQDGISAVVGRLGALPRRFPATFATRDLDTGRTGALHVQVADERAPWRRLGLFFRMPSLGGGVRRLYAAGADLRK